VNPDPPLSDRSHENVVFVRSVVEQFSRNSCAMPPVAGLMRTAHATQCRTRLSACWPNRAPLSTGMWRNGYSLCAATGYLTSIARRAG